MPRDFASPVKERIRAWWPRRSMATVRTRVAQLEVVPFLLVILIGFFAFFHNLDLALFEGTEGLYAHITRELVRSQEYFQLRYQGAIYNNKTPFFFWLLALSTSLLGENEVALRLPGALFSLGTMILTYLLAKALFSRIAGLCAALVVATTHVFLWYGRRVLLDSGMAFFITLALFAWVRPSLHKGGSWWYLVSFLSMALGTMVKGLHAFGLPLLLIVAYSTIRRDFRAFKSIAFWAGLFLSAAVVGWYAAILGPEFQWQFRVKNLAIYMLDVGIVGQGRSIYSYLYYLYMMWAEFFPWSFLIPSSLVVVFSQRQLRNQPSELFAISWILVFFLALSLAKLKRESYLMPIVPGLGLIIGYYYQVTFSSSKNGLANFLFRIMLAFLIIVFALAVSFGPSLLQRRWNIPLSPFPTMYGVTMLGICGILVYAGIRAHMRMALVTFSVLAVWFLIGVVHFVLPAIDKANSARRISDEIKVLAQNDRAPFRLLSSGWPSNEDLVYYLSLEPEIPRIETEQALLELVSAAGHVVIVADTNRFARLGQRTDLAISLLREFQQPRKKNFVLLSVRSKEGHSVGPDRQRVQNIGMN